MGLCKHFPGDPKDLHAGTEGGGAKAKLFGGTAGPVDAALALSQGKQQVLFLELLPFGLRYDLLCCVW